MGGGDGSTAATSKKAKFTMAPYPKASEIPPWGHSIFSMMWNRDPTPFFLKSTYMVLTTVALIALFHMDLWLPVSFLGLDTSWDEAKGFDSTHNSLTWLPVLLEQCLGLSQSVIYKIFYVTLASYLAFIVADQILPCPDPSLKADDKNRRGYPWPASWRADNYVCYHDMFAEPIRLGSLIRRPSNALSNVTFFFTGLLIMQSAIFPSVNNSNNTPNIFWLSDAMFGIMVFILSIASTLWHASNAPWTQYVDLWSMDGSIFYLNTRSACFGGMLVCNKYTTMSQESAQTWASGICVLLYSIIILILGRVQWKLFQDGCMHGKCPISGRARLAGTSDVFGAGHKDLYVGADFCLFGILPVFLMIIPLAVETFLLGSVGSVEASKLTAHTLVVGWSYRLTERWVLDCNPIMNWCNEDPTMLKRTVALLLSPTGVLHATTGITILVAYAHARSTDDVTY